MADEGNVDLDEVLNGDSPETAVAEPEVKPEDTPKDEGENKPEGDATDADKPAEDVEEPKGETDSVPPADKTEPTDTSKPGVTVPLSALIAERDKRQTAEKKLAGQSKAEEPKRDYFDDPEGAIKASEDKLRVEFNQQRGLDKLDISETLVRPVVSNYDDLRADFMKYAESDPGVLDIMMQSENPANFIVELVNSMAMTKELRKHGSIEKMRESIREEERVKLAEEGGEAPGGNGLPPTLSDTTSAPIKGGEAPAVEHMDLDDIVKGKNKN